MNTRSAREYITLTPIQFSATGPRPSNKSDLGSSIEQRGIINMENARDSSEISENQRLKRDRDP
jgi:hypothetical protein